MIDAATGVEWPVAVMPPVGIAGHAAWSPDGARVALSRFGRRPTERVGGSDILAVGAAGGVATPVAEHDVEGALLGSPAWTRDGNGVFYDYLPPNGGPIDSRVEYVASDGSGRRVVVQPGAWPSLTSDGRALLYVRPARNSNFHDELVLFSLDGAPERVLITGGQFVQIVSPRQSPDGRQVAFVGSLTAGEEAWKLPNDPWERPDPRGSPTKWGGLAGSVAARLTADGSSAALREAAPRIGALQGDTFLKLGVMAHGPPGDLWVVSMDGGQPWQRTAFEEDEPTIAWSPDGVWVAMLSGGGLYMVDVEGWRPSRVVAPGGFGSIDWR